ncbi:MAG: isopeptide-forming domain-containing fimbrial protein, partial [Prevotellaceae bacterium]|nr:isopeptide-forming domain-containing fimbrial protein [Prevotellaceae bacterium]
MNTLYNKSNNKKHKILFMLLMLAMSPALLLAQTMTEKPTMGFSGAYDIRMISAPIMHPVWLKSGSSNSNMDILQEITTDEQLQFGRLTTQNNDLGGFPNAPAGAPAGAAKMGVAYADCDEDMNTFQSSAAYLDFGSEMECTTVQAAYLYWVVCTGNTTTYKPYPGKLTSRSHNGGATGNSSTAHTIKFKTPLDVNYHTITADRSGGTLPNNVYFKDVTSLVQNKGGGMYWVADVGSSSDLGDGGVAAWSLVVIFSPPNCPNRVIKFWEANSEMKATGGWDMNLDFAPGEVPATGNSVSYMGICALDGEGFAFDLMVDRQMTYADVEQNNYIGFKSSLGTGGSGGTTGTPAKINVFTDNQPYDAGPTVPFPALDGVFCSRISSWDKDAGTNGNDLSRRPENRYTAGYDAHHIKLPAGAMGASARSATMSLVCERAGTKKSGDNPCGGGYTPFMAYMAIETLQPNLKMTKKAVSPTVETGKDITYRITTKNIGGLKSNAGALIVDTLDLPVDMIDESSIKFFDKDMNPITTVTYQIENKGADNNETLKFTLPEIAAGVNEVATDSITIEFSVRVKEKDRMDIWSVGCRREIRNKATIFYKTTEGADLIAGSNATAGCGGFGEPEIVRVDDQDLEDLIEETHNMTINLSDEVNSATPPLIVARVRQLLETQLTKLGRPTSEAALYTVFTDNMVAVLPTDVMTNAVAIQNYIAWRNVGSDCEEEFYFTIEVAKVPKITVVSTAPTTCVGETNGTATIRATEGDPVYVMKVVDAVDDNTVFFQSNATNVNSYDFSVDGLKAGDYKIILTDISNTPVTQNFSIADPDPFTTTITSACDGSGGVEFMANPTGRPLAGLQYAWKEFDGTNWIPAAGTNNAQNYTPVIGSGKKYSVTVCDGSCVVTELIDLPLLSVPDEEVSISSTPPHTTIFAAATTIDGIATTDSYSYNW